MESGSRDVAGDSIGARFLRWLQGTDAAKRYPSPGLVVFYRTGGTPKSCSVRNISFSGIYIFTKERWLPGSVIPMTLQRMSANGKEVEDWIAVLTQVVRTGPDGYGLGFVFSRAANVFGDEIPIERVADGKALKRFLKSLKLTKGQG